MKKILLFVTLFITTFLTAATPEDVFVIAVNLEDLICLDPAELFEDPGVEYAHNTYDRLISYDAKQESLFKSALAKSWTISEDGKVYTFQMQDDVRFASGNPVTAEDAAFSLQRVVLLNKSPAYLLTQFGWSKENVKEKIYTNDKTTLLLETEEPYAPSLLLYCLTSANAAIVEKSVVLSHEKQGDLGNAWLKTHHAGSGPFQLEQWSINVGLFLKRNDHYYQGPATYHSDYL